MCRLTVIAPPQSLHGHLRSSTAEYCRPLNVPFPASRSTDPNWPRLQLPQCGHWAMSSSTTGLSLLLLPFGRPVAFFAMVPPPQNKTRCRSRSRMSAQYSASPVRSGSIHTRRPVPSCLKITCILRPHSETLAIQTHARQIPPPAALLRFRVL